MYLLDTNILLELLLNQEKADEVQELFLKIPQEQLNLSEFSLGSVGVILVRRKMYDIFLKAMDDMFLNGGVGLVRLNPEDMQRLIQISKRFELDYDDAYQYVVAEKYNLLLVSLDSDFDKTERGRVTPSEILPKF